MRRGGIGANQYQKRANPSKDGLAPGISQSDVADKFNVSRGLVQRATK